MKGFGFVGGRILSLWSSRPGWIHFLAVTSFLEYSNKFLHYLGQCNKCVSICNLPVSQRFAWKLPFSGHVINLSAFETPLLDIGPPRTLLLYHQPAVIQRQGPPQSCQPGRYEQPKNTTSNLTFKSIPLATYTTLIKPSQNLF